MSSGSSGLSLSCLDINFPATKSLSTCGYNSSTRSSIFALSSLAFASKTCLVNSALALSICEFIVSGVSLFCVALL